VVEANASEDEDTCSGLVFKRKRKFDVAGPANSASDDRSPSFREHPLSASSPCDLVVQEGGGRVPLGQSWRASCWPAHLPPKGPSVLPKSGNDGKHG